MSPLRLDGRVLDVLDGRVLDDHQQGVATGETSLGALACGRQGDQHDGADGQDELGSRCRSWWLGRPGEREERWGSRSVFDWRVLEYNPTLRLGR